MYIGLNDTKNNIFFFSFFCLLQNSLRDATSARQTLGQTQWERKTRNDDGDYNDKDKRKTGKTNDVYIKGFLFNERHKEMLDS